MKEHAPVDSALSAAEVTIEVEKDASGLPLYAKWDGTTFTEGFYTVRYKGQGKNNTAVSTHVPASQFIVKSGDDYVLSLSTEKMKTDWSAPLEHIRDIAVQMGSYPSKNEDQTQHDSATEITEQNESTYWLYLQGK